MVNARAKPFSHCLPRPLAQCAASIGDRVLRLQDEPAAILKAMHRLGRLRILTANSICSTAVAGNYRGLCLGRGGTGYLPLDGSTLEFDLDAWGLVLAVVAPVADIPPRSLLFFDTCGELLQVVSVCHDGPAFEELVCATLHFEQHSLPLPGMPAQRCFGSRPDLCALERDWGSACDEESFEQMLRGHGLSRLSAFEQVSNSYALRIHPESLPALLTMAARSRYSLSVDLPNAGARHCLQGVPSTSTWQGSRLVSLFGPVTFACDMSGIGSCWRVRRRDQNQVVTSVEVFDHACRPVLRVCPTAVASWQGLLAQALLPVRSGVLPRHERPRAPGFQEN